MLSAVLSCAGVGWGQAAVAAASWAPAAGGFACGCSFEYEDISAVRDTRGQRGVAYTVFEV